MKRAIALTGALLLAVGLLLGVSGCSIRGADGKAYLGLDWTYTPVTVYFPMLPLVVTAGAYYEHPAGTYYGEYTAWNWDFYSFWYTLEINEGSYGDGFFPGEDGADRLYTLFLNSWGPELYYFEDARMAARQTATGEASTAERELALAAGPEPQREPSARNGKQELDPERYDLEHPDEFHWMKSGPGWTLSVEGVRYGLRER